MPDAHTMLGKAYQQVCQSQTIQSVCFIFFCIKLLNVIFKSQTCEMEQFIFLYQAAKCYVKVGPPDHVVATNIIIIYNIGC